MKKNLCLKYIVVFCCMIILLGAGGKLSCKAAEETVRLNRTSITMVKGTVTRVKLLGASGKVKWRTTKKSVAKVSSSGYITAVKSGKCVIKAIYGGKTHLCKVRVLGASKYAQERNSIKKNKGKVLLAGSSSMARWASAQQAFAPYEVVNVAISGTTMKQWSSWYKTMILPYKPKAIVWYVGGNDLWQKRTPVKTAKLFCETVKKLHKALPKTQIYFVSVYTNIKRESISGQILGYNERIKKFCENKKYITYIDLATPFNNNEVSLEQLLADGLHPNKNGYLIWEEVVGEAIKEDLEKKKILW